MWIFCCGAKRSGSTLQYNIVSKIVEITGRGKRIEHHESSVFGEIREKYKNFDQLKVFKTHVLTDEIKEELFQNDAVGIYSFRDIRDVVVSFINKGWIQHKKHLIEGVVEKYLTDYENWMSVSDCLIIRKYEDYYSNIDNEVLFLSKALGIQLTKEEVGLIANGLSIESFKSYIGSNQFEEVRKDNHVFDKKTLLHQNHIFSGQKEQFLSQLNHSDIVTIERLAYKWLLEKQYRLYTFEGLSFLSLSQHADDYIIWQLFGRRTNGLIIEVGAFDGVHLSNSFSLEKIGWRAICIEPNPVVFEYLKKNRPESVNFNCAIVESDESKEVDFFQEEIGVLSGCRFDEADIKKRYARRGLTFKKPKLFKVNARTLNSILEEACLLGNVVDVVSIDVEGHELDVLKGLDFNIVAPILFVIEANDESHKQSILNFFSDKLDYLFLGNNHQNLFIMRKKFIKKYLLRNIEIKDYVPAKQFHPVDQRMALQSIKPNFQKSSECQRFEKYFGIF